MDGAEEMTKVILDFQLGSILKQNEELPTHKIELQEQVSIHYWVLICIWLYSYVWT